MTASGTAGYGTELAGYLDLSALGAVVVKSLAAYEWAGNPAPRLHPTAARDAQRRRAAGPRRRRTGSTTSLPDLLRDRGHRRGVDLGAHRSTTTPRAADLLAAAPPEVVAVEVNLSCPNLEGRDAIFAHDAELSAEVVAATAGVRAPALGQAERQHRPHRRGRRAPSPRPAPRR